VLSGPPQPVLGFGERRLHGTGQIRQAHALYRGILREHTRDHRGLRPDARRAPQHLAHHLAAERLRIELTLAGNDEVHVFHRVRQAGEALKVVGSGRDAGIPDGRETKRRSPCRSRSGRLGVSAKHQREASQGVVQKVHVGRVCPLLWSKHGGCPSGTEQRCRRAPQKSDARTAAGRAGIALTLADGWAPVEKDDRGAQYTTWIFGYGPRIDRPLGPRSIVLTKPARGRFAPLC